MSQAENGGEEVGHGSGGTSPRRAAQKSAKFGVMLWTGPAPGRCQVNRLLAWKALISSSIKRQGQRPAATRRVVRGDGRLARADRRRRAGGTKMLRTVEKVAVKRCRPPGERKPCICRSRFRSGQRQLRVCLPAPGEETRDGDVLVQRLPVEAVDADLHRLPRLRRRPHQPRKPRERHPEPPPNEHLMFPGIVSRSSKSIARGSAFVPRVSAPCFKSSRSPSS